MRYIWIRNNEIAFEDTKEKCPREVGDNFGTMVCFHPRYALGDHHNYVDKDDFLREMTGKSGASFISRRRPCP